MATFVHVRADNGGEYEYTGDEMYILPRGVVEIRSQGALPHIVACIRLGEGDAVFVRRT